MSIIKPPLRSCTLTIVILSVLYSLAFWVSFAAAESTMAANLGLIPIFFIAWWWGIIPGLIMHAISRFLTATIIETINIQTYDILSMESVLGNIMHILFAIVIGTISSLIRKLQKENTERLKAERRLEEYKNNLEDMVSKRTQELEKANARLHQIEKMEAVGQLAGGVAHDFNNHLTIIQGYCEFLLNRHEMSSEAKRVLNQIYNSGKRSADLTKQLLAFSRQGMYDQQVVDINSIVVETINLLNRSMQKNITIQSLTEAASPYVWGGASHLQNAILNLALNARDAMPDGGILTIETFNQHLDQNFGRDLSFTFQTGNYVVVSVKDTGTGIEKDVLDHIFEPFFTTKKENKGTGMGLAAVYGIAKSHGGAITVDSTLGKGTTFNLYLPITNKVSAGDKKKNVFLNSVREEQILIVDDDRDVSQTIKDMISSLGYSVMVADSGEEAVSVFRDKHRDIRAVFIDMVMPGMDGGRTFFKLKEIDPQINAIMVSGYTLTENVQHAIENGAKGFLQKPFGFDQIKEVLVKIMGEGERNH
ncbi:MAG: response regulator [Chitinispirillaceae bacterium]